MQKPRSKPKQRRAQQMRQQILDATVQLLGRDSGPVTTNAIADAAHVSIGTVYRYFNDREEILGVLLEGTIREIFDDLTVAVGASLDLDLEESTHAIVEALTSSFERHAPVLGALMERGVDTEMARRVEETLFTLARVIPTRHRPDLTPSEIDDLVFVMMGFTANGCLRIALQRPPRSNRDAMVAVTGKTLAAALLSEPGSSVSAAHSPPPRS
jgi:AcrR family transcriptional regulator